MSAEKTVYFVRHGQSKANISPVFQPLDSPLTSTGEEQAAYIAERINKLSFDALIASPLERARQTAEKIGERTKVAPEYSELFVERWKPTGLEGRRHDDAEAHATWKEWDNSLYTPGLKISDGECFDEHIDRVDRALKYLEERPEQILVVVTHGWLLRSIFARVLLGNELTGPAFRNFQSRIEMENTGLSVLKYGERFHGAGWYVWVYNDHAHLG